MAASQDKLNLQNMTSSSHKEQVRSAALGCIVSLALLKLIHFDDPISMSLFLSWCIPGILTGPVTAKLHNKMISTWGRLPGQPLLTYFTGLLILWPLLIIGRFVAEALQGIDSLSDPAAYSSDVYVGLLFILLFYGTFVLGSLLLPIWMAIRLKKQTSHEQGKEMFSAAFLIDFVILSLFWGSSFFLLSHTAIMTKPSWHKNFLSRFYVHPYITTAKQNLPTIQEIDYPKSMITPLDRSRFLQSRTPYDIVFIDFRGVKCEYIFHERLYLVEIFFTKESWFGHTVTGPSQEAVYLAAEIEYKISPENQTNRLKGTEYVSWESSGRKVHYVFKEPLRELTTDEADKLRENDWDLSVLGVEVITNSPVPEKQPELEEE